MTISPDQNPVQEQKPNDKEYNFRAIEAKLQQERNARVEAEKKAQEAEKRAQEILERSKTQNDDEDDSEPYVDHKKLDKKLSRFGQNTQSEIQKAMELAKIQAKEELKQEMWLEQNPDFFDTMQKHAGKFAERAPKLADTILKMPDTFERQKLVYQNIKELGLDRPEQKQPSIQETVDAKRRSPFYQPTGVGTAPYSQVSDFSSQGQEQAYKKMKELQKMLRI